MFRDPTIALIDSLEQILEKGCDLTIQGHRTKTLLSHLIRIQDSTQRVCLIPYHEVSIFSVIAEAVWAIGGRSDRGYLRYSPANPGISHEVGFQPRIQDSVADVRNIAHSLTEPCHPRTESLYPAQTTDYIDTTVLFCDSWLHFKIVESDLYLSLASRKANLLTTLYTTIFKWSVLQEIIAFWTNANVGQMTVFLGSLYLPSHCLDQVQKAKTRFRLKTLYDFGFSGPGFGVPLSEFDRTIQYWFEIEEKSYSGRDQPQVEEEIGDFGDDFLRCCLQMLHAYNKYESGATLQDVAHWVSNLPSSDFKLAALEYFCSRSEEGSFEVLPDKESEFLHYYWEGELPAQVISFETIFDLLKVLHHRKTLVYKDSWKKYGEVLGIFANISRKYDRIGAIVADGARATADETLFDTLADLAVYSAKYLTYLAEFYKPIFIDFLQQYQPTDQAGRYCHNEGFNPIAGILIQRYHSSHELNSVSDIGQCYRIIQQRFSMLEEILIDGDWRTHDPRKCTATADLAIAAVQSMLLLSIEEPNQFERFEAFIENL